MYRAVRCYHEPRGDQSYVGDPDGYRAGSVGIFFMHNGFLLFRLNSYIRSFPVKSPAWR